VIGLVILVVLLIGSFAVLRPFFSALLWAVVLSFSIWPVHQRLARWLGGRRAWAALLITVALAAALVVPLTVAVANLADDARSLARASRAWLQSGGASPAWLRNTPLIGPRVADQWEGLASELSSVMREPRPVADASALDAASPDPAPPDATTAPPSPPDTSKLRQTLRAFLLWTRSWILTFGLAVGQGLFQIALSLLLTFFFLSEGEALAERLSVMVRRISGEQGLRLLDVAGGTVRGVVYGILGTALAQGLMAGIGFLIAGVPGATLLGLLTFVLSVLPMGPPLVWLPVSIWLFYQGSVGWGIFMLVWGVGVSSIDNVIKPWIISRGAKMPFILILLGVLGGALTFGLIGVFIGPTLLAVAYRLVDEWSRRAVPAPVSSRARATTTSPPPP
jgi:predicted PurR-regulated permease PerM